VADELSRWAAERAPALLARAETEAVAMLRDALVRGALRHRERGATERETAPPPEPAARPRPQSGDVLWTYCVLRAGTPHPANLAGVDASNPVERVDAGDLAALVSRVPLSEFGEEPLRTNLNNLEWLERVARGHEAVLERTLEEATIVPLRLCTIFEDEDGVRRMLADQRPALTAALDVLDGHQEWGVKLLVDREALEAAARSRSPEADALADELDTRSAGGAYMLKRRLERQVREAADEIAVSVADDVHARLQDWATDAVLNPPQNRDLSGHEGEMLLNGAYLVETPKVARLRELVGELQERHRGLGVRLDLTGPWPPYNFMPRDSAAVGSPLA
jgi:Gas vesicle synthesis protein GvpL/GvpF